MQILGESLFFFLGKHNWLTLSIFSELRKLWSYGKPKLQISEWKKNLLLDLGAQKRSSATLKVKGVNFRLPNFESFSLLDLERLKEEKRWLSDSHVTLSLLLVLFFIFSV